MFSTRRVGLVVGLTRFCNVVFPSGGDKAQGDQVRRNRLVVLGEEVCNVVYQGVLQQSSMVSWLCRRVARAAGKLAGRDVV